MSVNSAGSALNVQQALVALRQTVQAEHVAAAAVTEVANQAAQSVQQTNSAAQDAHDAASSQDGRGEVVDVEA
ncbi:hypothetical protein V5T82_12770 [Magnetovibrio sp. PR-2]|uniref:hypothetical protein n=1 Tax=Magnetovibrio sp. PR-2 TaxID=3120356 RepID=UPI002FCE650B